MEKYEQGDDCGKSWKRPKYKQLTLYEKAEVIKLVEKGEKKSTVAKKFGLSNSAVTKIVQNQEKYKLSEESLKLMKNKTRIDTGKQHNLEKSLFQWFKHKQTLGIPVSGPLIKEKALFFNRELGGPETFRASDGWLSNFKRRFGISQISVRGEKLLADHDGDTEFNETIQQVIADGNCSKDNIYNADETGLNFELLPDKTLASLDETEAPGHNQPKDRVTLMVSSNASGSHNVPLMLVEKSNSPRCFKNVKQGDDCGKSRKRPKYKQLTLYEKAEVIKLVEKGEKKSTVAKKFGLSNSAVTKIVQNQEKYKLSEESLKLMKNKTRIDTGKQHNLEKSLFQWFKHKQTLGIPVSGPLIKEKALFFNRELGGPETFRASDGWLSNFKRRFGISQITVRGEKLSADHDGDTEFNERIQQVIADGNCSKDNIYNADETGLNFKLLPDKTLASLDETEDPGHNQPKDRVTLMVSSNASGSHNVPLMLVEKSNSPRCFKNVKQGDDRGKSRKRPKYKQLTLYEKAEVIKLVEKGEKKSTVAKKFGLSNSAVTKIVQNQEKYKLSEESLKLIKKKTRIDTGKQHNLEKSLFQWFKHKQTLGIPVSGPLIKEKALFFNRELGGPETFRASQGWLSNFKRRFRISQISVQGEKLSADHDGDTEFNETIQQVIVDGNCSKDNIYNADETDLYFELLPDKTLASLDETEAPGHNQPKDRVTLMVSSNASGSHNVPLMLVEKSNSPRCFKNVKQGDDCGKSRKRPKYKQLTLYEKAEVIKLVEKGEKKSTVAKKFGLSNSAVTKIVQNQEKYKLSEESLKLMKNKTRIDTGKQHNLEKSLFQWFKHKQTLGIPVSGPLIKEKALFFNRELGGPETFRASKGWLSNFKRRFGISQISVQGEKLSADHDGDTEFNETIQQVIADGNCSIDNIYNADETGLNFELLPDKTLASLDETEDPGHNQPKDRVTLMVSSNSPRCFNNVKQGDDCGKSRKRPKYKQLTLYEKAEVIKLVVKGEKKSTVAKKFGLSNSAVTKIVQNQEKYKLSEESLKLMKNKTRIDTGKQHNLEKSLFQWFKHKQTLGIPVSGPLIKEKALFFNRELDGPETFRASKGWLSNFKRRFRISQISVQGEKLSADHDGDTEFNETIQQVIADGNCSIDNIYNADETGLNFELLPDKTLASLDETEAPGHNQPKDRVTLMVSSNSPRCFNNVKQGDDCGKSRKRPKYKQLTLYEKAEVIKLVVKGEKKSTVAKKFGLSNSAVTKIVQNQEKYKLSEESLKLMKNKTRIDTGKQHNLEKSLFQWFKHKQTLGIPVSGPLIKEKALFFNRELGGPETFRASDGWLSNFKRRFGISQITVRGEKLSTDHDGDTEFNETIQQVIADGNCSIDNIYNADETGLNFELLPDKTLASLDETEAPGHNQPKDRVTLMVSSNASGSHNVPLMLVEKSNSPRCFKNVKQGDDCGKSQKRPKYKQLTLYEKADVIKLIEKGEKKSTVAKKFGLSNSAVTKIVQNQEKYKLSEESLKLMKNKTRIDTGKQHNLEKSLFQWFKQKRTLGIPLSGPLIKEKALFFNRELGGPETFRASDGWLSNFKRRFGISQISVQGEKLSTDHDGDRI